MNMSMSPSLYDWLFARLGGGRGGIEVTLVQMSGREGTANLMAVGYRFFLNRVSSFVFVSFSSNRISWR